MNASILRPTDPAEEIDFVVLWRVVWSYKFLIAGIVAMCTGAAIALALTATSIFRAEVAITEASETGMGSPSALTKQLGGLAGLAGIDLGGAGNSINSEAVLKSRRLVEEFIKRHDLLPQLYAKSKRPPSLWRAVNDFRRDMLDIREDRRSQVLTVSIKWRDPAAAARWANDFVALTNELLRARAIQDSQRNIEYLNEQIKTTNVVELQKVMYNLIETETKTLMLAKGRTEYAFTVIDPAVTPELRISPRRTLMVIAGAALGLFFGVVCAFTLDALRRRRPPRATHNDFTDIKS